MKSLATTEVAHLEHLTAGLADPTDLDVAIHTTRTGIKQLRAFLRLARQSIGTSTYRTENGALGHTARLLAPARDAYVLIETAGELGATDCILAELGEDHTRAIDALEAGSRIEAVHRLEAMIDRWRLLEWHGPDSLSIGAGLVRTYGRGLADLETVRTAPVEEAFHGWRRRVKYLRYQLEALDAPNMFLGPYTLLGDDLGFEHDQTVLLGVCGTGAVAAPRAPAPITLFGGCAANNAALRKSVLAPAGGENARVVVVVPGEREKRLVEELERAEVVTRAMATKSSTSSCFSISCHARFITVWVRSSLLMNTEEAPLCPVWMPCWIGSMAPARAIRLRASYCSLSSTLTK